MQNAFYFNNFRPKRPKFRPKWPWQWHWNWKKIGKILAILAGVGFGLVLIIFAYYAQDLPSPGKINSRQVIESTKIYDRTGDKLLYEVHGEEKRTLVSFESISEYAKAATITLEDQDFYSHHGVQFTAILRAAVKDILGRGAMQGGSTITQQFVKNSILTTEKTMARKIKELILSIELELKFSKDEILGMYLNEIPYGSNAYGIEAATRTFFDKSAKDLELEEAALLASLPKAPTYYSPYGSHTEALKIRQEMAIDRMAKLGYVSQEAAEAAKQVDIFGRIQPFRENISAPHFVMYIKEYLENKYGEDLVEKGGLRVYTTLDWDKQQVAEKAVREGAENNIKSWNAYNASLVAMDPKTGQILAMVGSKDYFGKSEPAGCISGKNCKYEPQDNVSIRNRQPGSSFKPYVYLTAFSKGYTPETMVFDVPTEFSTNDGKPYGPQNYDGKFHGPLQLKETLACSLNIPAVKVLYLAGVKDAILLAKKMGINTLTEPSRYGLSLVLGGGEVKLLEHVNAFSTLATGGIRHDKASILRIENNKGEILEKFESTPGERVVEEKYVAMVDHILSTNGYRVKTFGENSPLRFDNRPVAAKTGTTNEFRDGWIIGYTPSLAAGVWAGNNDNTAMRAGADGVNVAAPIWRAFMDASFGNHGIEKFPEYKADDNKTGKDILDGKLDIEEDVRVCEIPGKDDEYCRANDNCPDKERKKKNFANVHTILYFVDRQNPRGDVPKNPSADPQYRKWEEGVEDWLKDQDEDYIIGQVPEDECRADDFAKFMPSVNINVIKDPVTFTLKVVASSNAGFGVKKLRITVNGTEIGSTDKKDLTKEYVVPVDERTDSIKVEATIEDKNGNKESDSETVSF